MNSIQFGPNALVRLNSGFIRSRIWSWTFAIPVAPTRTTVRHPRLSEEGLRLSGSGRQRESERGALILRLVHISHARGLGLNVPLLLSELKQGEGGGAHLHEGNAEMVDGDISLRFLEGLCSVLTHR